MQNWMKNICINDSELVIKAIGERIMQLKERSTYKTSYLSHLADVDRMNVSEIIKAEHNYHMKTLYKIISAFGLTPDEFFNDDFEMILYRLKEYQRTENILSEICTKLDKKRISSLIKKVRGYLDVSQRELAVRIGVTREKINILENGRGKMTSDILLDVFNIINVDLESFLDIFNLEGYVQI